MFVAYQKISSFKSPYDKFLTISKAWEIISHYVSLIDDPGVDVMWSIMASGNPFKLKVSDKKLFIPQTWNIHFLRLCTFPLIRKCLTK